MEVFETQLNPWRLVTDAMRLSYNRRQPVALMAVKARHREYTTDVAKVVADPKSLPERSVPIHGAKPPVYSLPYKDLGHPEEVDAFRKLVREIRRQSPTQPK
jgi:hypothetical protein